MADYRVDLEEGLKQSVISNARLQQVVNHIHVDRHAHPAVKRKMKWLYRVVAVIAVGIFALLFNPFHKSSLSEWTHSAGELPMGLQLDEQGNYTGFSNLPLNYSIEDAKNAGYIVEQDSVVIANRELWDRFVASAGAGRNSSVRIFIALTKDDSRPAIRDLYFQDGYYYLFDSDSEQQNAQGFSFLLTLEGQFGNPKKDSSVVILTDDRTLTFDTIMKSILSSNMDYIKSVSPYKLIFFNSFKEIKDAE